MSAAHRTGLRFSLATSLLAALLAQPVLAQESWNPFQQWQDRPAEPRAPRPREAAPAAPANAEPARAQPLPGYRRSTVERSALAPIMAPDSSGLPLELWSGLTLQTIEQLMSALTLPPRSPALRQLWRRMLLSSAPPPPGLPTPDHFLALRLEALYRSGWLAEMAEVLSHEASHGPLVDVLQARRDIGTGLREEGCRKIRALVAPGAGLPGRLKGEMQLLAGYCAASDGDTATAGLAAELAREEGVDAEVPLEVLTAVAAGSKPRLRLPKRVLLLDYRFLELLGPVDAAEVRDAAEPALLAVLARASDADPRHRIAAAEAALRAGALAPEAVADVYRRQPRPPAGQSDASDVPTDPFLLRARLFRAIEFAQTADLKRRLLRAMLDEARRMDLFAEAARMVLPSLASLRPAPDAAGFAETAAEAALAAGDLEQARAWAQAAHALHWLALIDIADPNQRASQPPSLVHLDDLAARGQLRPELLPLLATVLDALDFDVPIALWDAASRMPQPAGGYLPETGVLADLAQAAKRRETAHTILLAMRALGPEGPKGANLLALGDAIRAVKAVGLEADARLLAMEALMPLWPRPAQ